MATLDPFGGDNQELADLKQKVDDLEAQLGSVNPRNFAGIPDKELSEATIQNAFGDGSDGVIALDGSTDFNDFSSRSGSIYTLTRDVFALNLTINTGITLKPVGHRIYSKSDLVNRGTIAIDGGAGSNGTSPSQGTGTNRVGGGGGGSGAPGGTAQIWAKRIINEGVVQLLGGAGGDGGDGSSDTSDSSAAGGAGGTQAHSGGSLTDSISGVSGGNGQNATVGTGGVGGSDSIPGVGQAGSGGGGGGAGLADAGGSGGGGGSVTSPKNLPRTSDSVYNLKDTQMGTEVSRSFDTTYSASTSGVFYGDVSTSQCVVKIDGSTKLTVNDNTADNYSFTIPVNGGETYSCDNVSSGATGSLYFRPDGNQVAGTAGSGGGGGGGGSSTGSHAGGGGGGAGGSGGTLFLVYGTKTGAGTYDLSGGAGGAAGLGDGASGSDGVAGSAGSTGITFDIEIG